ncbi:MAG: response regulator [Anaerolineae bacterium]|nr:response regulator [Anaerolineae bacterium]
MGQQNVAILLVEDDKAILEGLGDLLSLELSKLGYQPEVRLAEHGAAALRIMDNFIPDLIISDIMMPVMGGYTFKEHVQANPAWVHIPFFFLTARTDRQAVSQGHRSGVERYITKPFDTNELIGQVKTQIELNRQRHALHQEKFDSLKRDFTWMINHELRTPLTYVSAYFELLKDSIAYLEDTGYSEESLRGIQSGCMRLIRLVENFVRVIDLRTGEAQKHFQEKAQVIPDVTGRLHHIINGYAAAAAAAQITLRQDIPEELPPLWGDPDNLREIIGRLLDNAIKFTRIKDTNDLVIAISAWVEEDELHIELTDNGIGFPGYAQDQIFELFYQHNRSHLEQQGAGIGLTIVKGLVELHRGRITAYGIEGEGSTFTITLPLYHPDSPFSQPHLNKKLVTILIIEDDLHLLDGLTDVLELPYPHTYQFNIIQASNGQVGLDKLQKIKPDLIISDISMPVMDGYEFYRHLRENPNWFHIPFIFLTARGERKDIHKGHILGAADYITKPYDNEDLISRVVARLDRYFQQQQTIQHNIEEWKRVILQLLQPDIASPILSVADYSEKLIEQLQQATSEEQLKEPLRGIQAGSQQLTRLIENFIALTELKTGETASAYYKLRSLSNELPLLFYEVAQECQGEADEANITIHPALIHNTPPIMTEPTQLRRLFTHLLRFALMVCAGRGQKHIFYQIRTHHSTLESIIEMPELKLTPHEQALIQALFRHNDQQLFREMEYGPNLTIVKGLVDLHNGQIELEQTPGSCQLSLQLPIWHG